MTVNSEEKRSMARQLNGTQRLLAQLERCAPSQFSGALSGGVGQRFAAPPPPGRKSHSRK